MSALARLAIEDRAGLVLATLSGEVDASNAREILDQLGAAMPSDARALVLDLSVATYLDSSGVRVLFELARRLRRSQQQLTLVAAPRARVRRVLDTIAVATIAPLHDSLPAALAAVATAPPAAGLCGARRRPRRAAAAGRAPGAASPRGASPKFPS